MKEIFHVCWSAGEDGLLCRDKEDYIRLINCVGVAAYQTDTTLLAYSAMSSHLHQCLRSKNIDNFMKRMRYMYTRYFNSTHKRRGSLGEPRPFVLRVDGLHHILTAIAYTLRNPLHHGVTATPFGYEFSSVHGVFQKELGYNAPMTIPDHARYKYLTDSAVLPSRYRMSESGLLLPECLIAVDEVEYMFSTARSYLYYLNRLSGERWEMEQRQDAGVATGPITLLRMEPANGSSDIKTMLANEYGRFNQFAMSDISLCSTIDTLCQERFGGRTVYEMKEGEKTELANLLLSQFRLPLLQVSRCVGLLSPLKNN